MGGVQGALYKSTHNLQEVGCTLVRYTRGPSKNASTVLSQFVLKSIIFLSPRGGFSARAWVYVYMVHALPAWPMPMEKPFRFATCACGRRVLRGWTAGVPRDLEIYPVTLLEEIRLRLHGVMTFLIWPSFTLGCWDAKSRNSRWARQGDNCFVVPEHICEVNQ